MATIEITAATALELPTPVRIDYGIAPRGTLMLKPEGGGPSFAAQAGQDGRLVALISGLKAGETVKYHLVDLKFATPDVNLKPAWGGLEFNLPEGQFGTYHYDSQVARPFLWPLLGPGQKGVTRGYPMVEIEGEEHDHPHHRSLWSAYGEVNGGDNWSEERNHASTRHLAFDWKDEGPVYAGFAAQNTWYAFDKSPLLNEMRTLRLYNAGPDVRLLDYGVHLMAAYRDVTFGDTKEGGILSVRVASSMDGVRGGVIENAVGEKGESQCWGKKADWCDYSGDVEGEQLGIAIFNHPGNSNGQPRWHVRDYGLMGTNPFATEAFNDGKPTPFLMEKGGRLNFRYRVLLHRGDAAGGSVADFYQHYAKPPMATVVG